MLLVESKISKSELQKIKLRLPASEKISKKQQKEDALYVLFFASEGSAVYDSSSRKIDDKDFNVIDGSGTKYYMHDLQYSYSVSLDDIKNISEEGGELIVTREEFTPMSEKDLLLSNFDKLQRALSISSNKHNIDWGTENAIKITLSLS